MNYNKLTPKMMLNLANPQSWAASLLPSVFGCIYTYVQGGKLPLWKNIALILCCVLMQSAVNTLNDYFDYVKGTDSKTDNLERWDAVLVYENINPKSALALGLVFLGVAAVLGIAAAWGACFLPYLIGVVGGLCVVLYSGGKTPISYLPIGEVISGLVMGMGIPVAISSIAFGFDEKVVATTANSLPFVIGIGMIMMTNNTCDIEKDKLAKRVTMPVQLGREKARKLYSGLASVWRALIVFFSIFGMPMGVGTISILLTLLVPRRLFKYLRTSPLEPASRIQQMKSIVKTNWVANGIFILMYALVAFVYVWGAEQGILDGLNG